MRGFWRGRIVIKRFSRCIAFFVLCSGFGHAQNKLSLQPYHWVFDYANELLLRNQVPMAGWATQPLNFGDMAQVLESNVPGKYADFLSNRIAQHLYGYVRSGERQLENPVLQMGALFIEKHGSMVGNDRFLSSVRWFSGLRFSENLTIFNAIDVDQNFGNDKAYLGKSWRDITALTEQAYIKYQTQKVQIKFGRDYIRWGCGYDAALAVSDASRPFDQLFFQLRSRRAQFSYFISKLNSLKLFTSADSIQEAWVDRYMSGGRIELYLFGNRVQLALSQFILWGERMAWNFII